ncbi:MAG: putative aminoglycoside phosphotransferase [Acidimicrobiales bacterium]|nr:putative aminoglycoside phosphotransferase [Acidimicrobiales bacterium]
MTAESSDGDSPAGGVLRFLVDEIGERAGVAIRDVRRLSGAGNARDAWSLDVSWIDGHDRTEQACVMLVKADGGQLETGLALEFRTLQALQDTEVPVPKPLWLDESGRWIGRPFFITALVPGTADERALRSNTGAAERVMLDLATAVARLHRLVPPLLEGSEGSYPVTAETAAARQLEEWKDVFHRNQLGPQPAVSFAFAWLEAHAPVAEAVSLVHGDLRLGNVLHDKGRLTCLLDWEMAHLGDPIEDLAWLYRRLWNAAPLLDPSQFLDRYRAESGFEVSSRHLAYYALFSEVKHAVISMTAARSFHDGRTCNLRMADRHASVATVMSEFYRLVSL